MKTPMNNKIFKVVGAVLVGVLLLFVGYQWGNNSSVATAATTNFGGDFQADSVDSLGTTANGGDGVNTLLGTTTIAHSPDGFVLWDDFTVGTTTPVRAALTNSGAPLMCDGGSLNVYSVGTTFAPSFKLAVGTSTSATCYSANLLASTTIATTTSTVTNGVAWNFILANGSSITLAVGDYTAAIASSTYYGNWTGQVSIHCWTLGE